MASGDELPPSWASRYAATCFIVSAQQGRRDASAARRGPDKHRSGLRTLGWARVLLDLLLQDGSCCWEGGKARIFHAPHFFGQPLVALPSLGQLPKALASDWAQCTHRLHSVVGGIHGNTKAGVSFGVGFRKKWVRTCSAREGRSRRPRLAARARRRFSLG
mgnify:CR=1 FL=1